MFFSCNRVHLLELATGVYLFFCGCYDIAFGKNHYFIYLFVQALAFFIMGFGYVGTFVPSLAWSRWNARFCLAFYYLLQHVEAAHLRQHHLALDVLTGFLFCLSIFLYTIFIHVEKYCILLGVSIRVQAKTWMYVICLLVYILKWSQKKKMKSLLWSNYNLMK